MVTDIFVNISVKDLPKSIEFFKKLGFTFNPQFTDDKGACLVLGEHIYYMLITEEFFKTFIKKEIADASKVVESINAIGVGSKEKVDELFTKYIPDIPKQVELKLPKLQKIELPKLQKING